MKNLFKNIFKLKQDSDIEIKEKEYLCALRLSYNNFDEKVNNSAKELYSECKKMA